MALNSRVLLRDMVAAARGVLADDWPELKEIAEAELKGVIAGFKAIERMRRAGKISQRQAKQLFQVKRNTAEIVLFSLEGVGRITAEKALNAAFKVVRDSVNTSLGFVLI